MEIFLVVDSPVLDALSYLNLTQSFWGQGLILSPFCRWQNWGLWRQNNEPKVSQPVSSRAGILTQVCSDSSFPRPKSTWPPQVRWVWGALLRALPQQRQGRWARGPWITLHLSITFSGHPPAVPFSGQLPRSGCSDIILLLLNVRFPLKNKKLLSQIIQMEMTLLLAEKQEKELFTVSFKLSKKKKKGWYQYCVHS